MYGDRFGSPGRDDRQDGTTPGPTPWDGAFTPRTARSDDVKVAGAPTAGSTGHLSDSGTTTTLPSGPTYAGPFGTQQFDAAHEAAAAPYEAAPHAGAPDAGLAYQGGPNYGTFRDDPAEDTAYDDFEAIRRTPPSRKKLITIAAVGAAVLVLGGAGAWALTGESGSGENDGVQQLQAQAPAAMTDAQRKNAEEQRRRELKKAAKRAARQDKTRPTLFAKGKPPTTAPGTAGDPVPAGEAQKIARAMLPDFGWSPSSQFGCLVNLWNKESHWNVHASSPTGAYGIPQALPGSKMASAGPDWQNSARTQIKWGLEYIKARYGSPCAAWAHSRSTGWY